jgi:hypothetical protein
MKGLNYELRCHHPTSAMQVMSRDYCAFLHASQNGKPSIRARGDIELNRSFESVRVRSRSISPTSAATRFEDEIKDGSPFLRQECMDQDAIADNLYDKSCNIELIAAVKSDVAFLFPPGQIGFAIVCIAAGAIQETSSGGAWTIDDTMKEYLASRFPRRSPKYLENFVGHVNRLLNYVLQECSRLVPSMRLTVRSPSMTYYAKAHWSSECCASSREPLAKPRARLGWPGLTRKRSDRHEPTNERANGCKRYKTDFAPPATSGLFGPVSSYRGFSGSIYY